MNVSLLLGSGFSIPIGYPSVTEISDVIRQIRAEGIYVASDGTAGLRKEFLRQLKAGTAAQYAEPVDQSRGNPTARKALEATICYFYDHLGGGNYEALYDALIQLKEGKDGLNESPEFLQACARVSLIPDPSAENPAQEWAHRLHQGLYMAEKILNQLLQQLLIPEAEPRLPTCYGDLCRLLARHSTLNEFYIHTLNHDLFLEKLMSGTFDFTHGVSFSEGFEELGSPFYGDYGGFKVRLSQYTGQYNAPVQLYKLHGSLDYWLFHENGADPGHYVPTVVQKPDQVAPYEIFRETERKGKLQYIQDITNYHPLFLSGVDYKKRWYEYPHFFKRLLTNFRTNLAKSDVLLVIGYGFRDEGINELLAPLLNDSAKKVIIIDKYPIQNPLVQEEMVRLGGLESFDFRELEELLDKPATPRGVIDLMDYD